MFEGPAGPSTVFTTKMKLHGSMMFALLKLKMDTAAPGKLVANETFEQTTVQTNKEVKYIYLKSTER